jgi:hypothetical protein
MLTSTAPIPAGTLCTLAGRTVRVYATIEVGALWDGRYRCVDSERRSKLATRDELVIGGGL